VLEPEDSVFLYFKFPIGWFELSRRTVQKAMNDNCFDLAAGLAYYFFLAVFPALLFVISLMAYLPLQGSLEPMLNRLGQIAPQPVVTILRQQIHDLAGNSSLLTVGILGTIWSSSSAMSAIITTLNTAYGIKETRPWWKTKLSAIALTLGLIIFLFIAFALILVGPQAAGWMDRVFHFGFNFIAVWKLLHWPVAFIFAIFAVDLVYYFGPDADSKWVWLTPGSLTATLLFICTSLFFKLYIINFENYNATYGAIGSVIILLLWFYFSGLSLLVGAELDSVIDEASGRSLKPVQLGQRKKIGAARDYE
jgi:membrane protein